MARRQFDRGYYGYQPYVPVATRRANAKRHAAQLAKKGQPVQPIEIRGRTIATTFWGKAWCDNLEGYSDFANRLPRGRTYVRNGSVVDLQISGGTVTAIVSGSEVYEVQINVTPLSQSLWKKIKGDCSQSIESLIDLMQGRFSQGVMARLTRQQDGLFPRPKEIKMRCSCPDWAKLCKHVAAVLYGVGARLDSDPEMLFRLRDVDHLELISQAVDGANLDAALSSDAEDSLAGQDLSDLFGIDLDAPGDEVAVVDKPSRRASPARSSARQRSPARQRSTAKKTRRKRTSKKTSGRQMDAAVKPTRATAKKKKRTADVVRNVTKNVASKRARREKVADTESRSSSTGPAKKKAATKRVASKKKTSAAAVRSAKKKSAVKKTSTTAARPAKKKSSVKKK